MLKRWRLLSLLALVPLLLSGCGKPFLSTLKPAGEVADKQYDLTVLSTLIMVVVVAVVSMLDALFVCHGCIWLRTIGDLCTVRTPHSIFGRRDLVLRMFETDRALGSVDCSV